jgi:GNAT superfamily N-acetyltransferase
MEGPRSPQESELPSVIEFLDKNLRPRAGWSISKEYPTAFQVKNLENIRIVTDPGQGVLSHAVIKPIILKSPLGLVKVATIGSVVTDPHRRNQGLSQAVLQDCLFRAEQSSCDLAVLWTDLYEFYKKLGFALAGSETTVTISEPMSLPKDSLQFRVGANIDPQALLKIYNQHSVHSLRSADDFRQFLLIPNSRVYTAWATDGSLAAYAVEGKGADLEGYIHEWGGKVSALLPLLNFIRVQYAAPIHIILGSHSQNLQRQLIDRGYSTFSGYLGMIKILNLGSLVGKILRYSRALGISDLHLEYAKNELQVGHSVRVYKLKGEEPIVRLFFGPPQGQELSSVDPSCKELLRSIFPLPLWFWGWDSI